MGQQKMDTKVTEQKQEGHRKPVTLLDQAVQLPLKERIKALPPEKRWPLTAGLTAVSLNSAMVGLICNSYFRRMCMLRGKGIILSMLPLVGACGVTSQAVWQVSIVNPLVSGKLLGCPLCAELRGGLVNFSLGALYPLILAAPINGAMAVMYRTIEVPLFSKKATPQEFLQFWVKKLRYFKVQFATIAVFQTLIGMYLAGKQFEVITLLQKPTEKRIETQT